MSEIWMYFGRANGVAVCNGCDFESGKPIREGDLWRHLTTRHRDVYERTYRYENSAKDVNSEILQINGSASRTSSTRTKSEVWKYFAEVDARKIRCNVGGCEVLRLEGYPSSTRPLWDHLIGKHPAVYRTTQNFAANQRTVQSTSTPARRGLYKRTHPCDNGASVLKSVSPSAAKTVSDVWKHFSNIGSETLRCKECGSEVERRLSRRSSTSPMWDHLKSQHRDLYEATSYGGSSKNRSMGNFTETDNEVEVIRHIRHGYPKDGTDQADRCIAEVRVNAKRLRLVGPDG